MNPVRFDSVAYGVIRDVQFGDWFFVGPTIRKAAAEVSRMINEYSCLVDDFNRKVQGMESEIATLKKQLFDAEVALQKERVGHKLSVASLSDDIDSLREDRRKLRMTVDGICELAKNVDEDTP